MVQGSPCKKIYVGDTTSSEDSDSDQSSYIKRRRTTKLVYPDEKFKQRGALKELMEMPLDVLYEIFGQLTPGDLIHLSRTSKALRRVLIHKSSISVWRQTYSNVNLPKCPDDLNEVQFAKLMFDPHCGYCMKSITKIIIWENYTRCCKTCAESTAAFGTKQEISGFLHSIIPQSPMSGVRGNPQKYCHRTAVQINTEYELASKTSTFSEWLHRKWEAKRTRKECGSLCAKWFSERARLRALELQGIRVQRYTGVIDRLYDMGWGEEIEKVKDDELWNHQAFSEPKELTNRVWDRILPSLTKVLTGIEARRLREEYHIIQKSRVGILRDVYNKFLASQPLDSIIPDCLHLATTPEFRAILDSPSETTVTARDFDILEATTAWRNSEGKKFLNLMRQHVPNAQRSDLALPTSIFICSYCKEYLRYPQALVHGCKSTDVTEDLFEDLGRLRTSDITFDAVAHMVYGF